MSEAPPPSNKKRRMSEAKGEVMKATLSAQEEERMAKEKLQEVVKTLKGCSYSTLLAVSAFIQEQAAAKEKTRIVPELGAAAWLPPQARLKHLATLPPAFPRERRRTAERAESATQKSEKRDAENGRAKRRRKQSGDPRRKREENTKKTRRKRVRFDDSFTFWTPKGDAKNDEENTKKTRRKQENGNEENEETDIFFTALSAFEWPS